jgi:hyperosmotically inducible periplasmic protein
MMISAYALCALSLATAPSHNKTSDGWITTKARIALMTADKVKSTDVHVDTINGTVSLYGHVDTENAKKVAEQKIKEIKGVKGVQNDLEVIPKAVEETVKRSDDEIKKAAHGALENETALKGESVKVLSVDNGVIVLGGKVKDPAAQLAAIECVEDIAGVRRIESRIAVQNEAPMITTDNKGGDVKDGWLTTKVKLKLIGNGDVPSTVVHVDTHRTKVTLWGVVETEKAKMEAEKEARSVDGVTTVANQLIVDPKKAEKQAMLPDSEIKDNVKKLLSKDDMRDIDVAVKDGIVVLTGKKKSELEGDRVALLSRTAKGARAVKNEIKIEK